MTDYIGAAIAKPGDLMQYGRKGMKWGQRIFSKGSETGDSGKKESTTPAKSGGSPTGSAAAKKPSGNIQDNVESSATRYARLAQQAKAGGASQMTEQDLKFFNARTDALSKINKMNEEQPSWLRETATKVIQQSAQRQMQTVADALADKYIGDPIKDALKGAVPKASDAAKQVTTPASPAVTAKATSDSTTANNVSVSFKERASSAASKAADAVAASKRAKGDKQYEATKKLTDAIDAKKASDPSLMNVTESVRYYKDNPSSNPTPPAGLSPNGYRLWLEQIKGS